MCMGVGMGNNKPTIMDVKCIVGGPNIGYGWNYF
jgi:hypothetical protein